MSDTSELGGEAAARWEARLRDADGLGRVLREADVDLSVDDFNRERVVEQDGRVRVTLKHSVGEGDYISATGVFAADDGSVVEVRVEDGYVAAPLAGHGTVWTYRDGAVEQSRWIS